MDVILIWKKKSYGNNGKNNKESIAIVLLHLTNILGVSNVAQSAGSQHLDIPEEAKIPNNVPKQSKKQGQNKKN